MTRHSRQHWLAAALTLGLVALLLAVFQSGGILPLPGGERVAAADTTSPLEGVFSGSIQLTSLVAGNLNDPLATPAPPPAPTPDPSRLDSVVELSLTLHQAGQVITGHVNLDTTLVYPQTTVIPATPTGPTPLPGTATPRPTPLAVGPRVTGAYDGVTLRLESEPFTVNTAGRVTTRQFRLVAAVDGEGRLVSGEYRETLTGFTQKPATAIGGLSLRRQGTSVNAATPEPPRPYRQFLPLLERSAPRP